MLIITQKKNRSLKKWWQRCKSVLALYKLMNNVVHGKAKENLRNKIDVRLVSNEKDYLKWKSKPIYMSQKIFDNDLVTNQKSKDTLTIRFE